MSTESFGGAPPRVSPWLWGALLFIGAVSLAAGVIVLAKPGDSLAALAVIIGIFMLIDGVVEIVSAIVGGTQARGLVAILGVLSFVVGALLIRHPIEGVAAVALFTGLWLIAIGVVRFIAAFETPEYRGWNIFVAVIELIAGIVIVASPEIGYATLALLTGIAFILNGVGMLSVGWRIRALAHEGPRGGHIDAAATT